MEQDKHALELEQLIVWIKETFSEEVKLMHFLDGDSWLNVSNNSSWLIELARHRSHYNYCLKCTEDNNLAGEDNCMESLVKLNVKSSNYYKKPCFTFVDCPFVKKYSDELLKEQYLQESGLLGELQEKTFDNYEYVSKNKEYLKKIEKFVDYVKNYKEYSEKGLGLYIYGEKGNGKTHLAIAILLEVLNQYIVPIKYINLQNLIAIYKGMLGNKDFEFDHFKLLNDVGMFEGLLVVDDIGTELDTRRNTEICYFIVNYRYDNSLPTIFTSNYNLSDLGNNRFTGTEGGKIADRILGRNELVYFNYDSYRKNEYSKLKNS